MGLPAFARSTVQCRPSFFVVLGIVLAGLWGAGNSAMAATRVDLVIDEPFADRKAGRAYFNGLRPYRRWGDVESAFAGWASEFRVRIDAIHGPQKVGK